MSDTISKHFVTFYSPGTFFAEESTKPIESWSVPKALEMAKGITERHGATPYGFRFTTRTRGPEDLDSKVTSTGPMYFFGVRIETREEIEERNLPDEEILRSNMRCNDIDRVVVTTRGWKSTLALGKDDIVLEDEA